MIGICIICSVWVSMTAANSTSVVPLRAKSRKQNFRYIVFHRASTLDQNALWYKRRCCCIEVRRISYKNIQMFVAGQSSIAAHRPKFTTIYIVCTRIQLYGSSHIEAHHLVAAQLKEVGKHLEQIVD